MANSKAYSETFHSLIQDVHNLNALHPAPSGTPGRPPGDTGPLLRSIVVLLHTAWENYVEQVAVEGAEFLLGVIGDDHEKLPRALRQEMGKLKDPWSLAGNKWKTVAKELVAGQASRLNTPNVAKTQELFELAIGLHDAVSTISWQKMSRNKVLSNIDEFVQDIRGEIVHKGTTPGALHRGGVAGWITFFDKLTFRLDEKIQLHLLNETGTSPW